jgi:hypothetical protein
MASDSPAAQQKSLHTRYCQLPDVQRTIAQFFAIYYEPISRANACTCWNMAIPPLSQMKGIKPLNSSQFSAQVTKLIQQGVLAQEAGMGPHCPELLVDIVTRDALKCGTYEPIVTAIHERFPIKRLYGSSGPRKFTWETSWLRELRMAIYHQDTAEIEALQEDAKQAYWKPTQTFPQVLQHVINNPFDPDWFSRLSLEFRRYGLRLTLEESARDCKAADEAFDLLEEMYHAGQVDGETSLVYAEQLWLRGHLREASGVLSTLGEVSDHPARQATVLGAIAFLTGDNDRAIADYRTGLKAAGKSKAAQVNWFEAPAAALYFLALLKDGSPAALQEAQTHCELLQRQNSHWLKSSMSPLWQLLQVQQGQVSQLPTHLRRNDDYYLNQPGLPALIEVYCLYWLNLSSVRAWLPSSLSRFYREASQADYGWIAMELAELLTRFDTDKVYSELAEALREECGSEPLVDIVKIREPWELSLKALTNLTQTPAKGVSTQAGVSHGVATPVQLDGVLEPDSR